MQYIVYNTLWGIRRVLQFHSRINRDIRGVLALKNNNNNQPDAKGWIIQKVTPKTNGNFLWLFHTFSECISFIPPYHTHTHTENMNGYHLQAWKKCSPVFNIKDKTILVWYRFGFSAQFSFSQKFAHPHLPPTTSHHLHKIFSHICHFYLVSSHPTKNANEYIQSQSIPHTQCLVFCYNRNAGITLSICRYHASTSRSPKTPCYP